MSDGFTPIKGKCTWWRERLVDEDAYNPRIRDELKRFMCSCFVEGMGWTFGKGELPTDCPLTRSCRYWIRHY